MEAGGSRGLPPVVAATPGTLSRGQHEQCVKHAMKMFTCHVFRLDSMAATVPRLVTVFLTHASARPPGPQASAPAHSFKHTQKAIREAFGLQIEEVFEWLDTKALASGSIGQVHRARLSAKGARITGGLAGGGTVRSGSEHLELCGCSSILHVARIRATHTTRALAQPW